MYLAADGAFGNLACLLLAKGQGLFLVSKLHNNSVLFYPPKVGSKKRKFGQEVDFGKLSEHEIGSEKREGGILTYFQINKVRTLSLTNILKPKNAGVLAKLGVINIHQKTQKIKKTA